jgi:hypothetical protein
VQRLITPFSRYFFGRAIWVAGIPFMTGIPLRQLDNLILNFVIHEATPGPFLAKVTRLWKFAKILKGDFHDTLVAAHRIYGRESQWLNPADMD